MTFKLTLHHNLYRKEDLCGQVLRIRNDLYPSRSMLLRLSRRNKAGDLLGWCSIENGVPDGKGRTLWWEIE
jgi:hypothetical protein